jgi:hypothetical protein
LKESKQEMGMATEFQSRSRHWPVLRRRSPKLSLEPQEIFSCTESSTKINLAQLRSARSVIKGRNEIRCDLSRFFFRHGVGRILFTGFKDVFKCPTVLGRASVLKQLNRERWTASMTKTLPLKDMFW